MRLRKSWEFRTIKHKGIRFKNKTFWFQIFLSSECDSLPKLGIIASRRFGNAVQRNGAKRRIREIFRTNLDFFPTGSKTIFLPKTGFLSDSFKQTESKILTAIQKTIPFRS